MKRWSYGANSYYKTTSIFLEEAPAYIFILEDTIMWICDKLPDIKIPFLTKIKITRDNEVYDVAEYYGGTVNQVFHCLVCMPVASFCCDRIETKSISIEWNKCKELFYKEDKDRWDEMEKEYEEAQKEIEEDKDECL